MTLKAATDMRHAVIMAGGSGTRLWPLSRRQRPKQTLRLFGGKSLLRQSYDRLRGLLPPEAIYVITLAEHLALMRSEVPEIPEQNLFGEPSGRDTANAVGLAAAILHRRDPDGVMGVFTADHVITPQDRFALAVDDAFALAERYPDALVTMGVPPASPHSGYGYLRRGQSLGERRWEVAGFFEKPEVDTAERLVAAGDHYWNSGMFTWRIETILAQLARHLPASHQPLAEIGRTWDTPAGRAAAAGVYSTLPKISIDYAVLEKAERVLMVEMDCRWLDVGSWTALESVLPADEAGNVSAAARVVHVGSRGSIVVAEDDQHLIATVGVEDLVIVHSADATLVCRKSDAERVRDLVARLQKEHGDSHL